MKIEAAMDVSPVKLVIMLSAEEARTLHRVCGEGTDAKYGKLYDLSYELYTALDNLLNP